MSAEAASEMPACLDELCGLSEDTEAGLLADILTRGWDQGCFLRIDGGTPLPELSPERIEALLAIVEGRARPHPEAEVIDPFEAEPLADRLPDGEAPGLVVISQRCDLIKPIAAEPLVEVASAKHSGDKELLSGARNNASSQFVHLADQEDGSG
ncbi:MAG TPA: hypothetical protein VLC07_01990, partial [Solirubrobacterales bacterium]|nr:hypothetical protein [Solirubrobacterales bacterium]